MRRWAETFTAVAGLLVVLAVALVGVLMPVVQAQAAVLHEGPMAAHAFDRLYVSVGFALAPFDRGPPVHAVQETTCDAFDNGSYRTSARQHAAAALAAHTDYANLVWSAGIAISGTTAQEQVRRDDGEPASPARTGVAANSADDVLRSLSATERRTLDDALRPDKLDHIFDPKHKFDPLVQQFGSREAAMAEIVRSIGGPLPKAGPFQIAQSIGGQTVIIRGAVVDGIPRIGTAFTP